MATALPFVTMGVVSNGHNGIAGNERVRSRIAAELPEQALALSTGSKWLLVGCSAYSGFIWTEKLTILFLLKRVARGFAVEKAVLPVMGLVVATYLTIVVVVTSYCRPFYKYWQFFPDPGGKFAHSLIFLIGWGIATYMYSFPNANR